MTTHHDHPENGELDGMRRDAQADADSDAQIAYAESQRPQPAISHRTPRVLAYGICRRQNVQFKTTIAGTTATQLGVAISFKDDHFTVLFTNPITKQYQTAHVYKTNVEGLTNEAGQPWLDGEQPAGIRTHGGSRPGAGRPATKPAGRKPHTVRLTDFELEQILEHYDSLQSFIEHGIATL